MQSTCLQSWSSRCRSRSAGLGALVAMLLVSCAHEHDAEAGGGELASREAETAAPEGESTAKAADPGSPSGDKADKAAPSEPAPSAAAAAKPAPAKPAKPASKHDACDARVVSSTEPCSDDPDPCGLKSGWEGDEYCLKPPPAGEGIQIHFGPRSYDDKADTDPYVLEPHEQLNNSMLAHLPAFDAPQYWDHVTVHMRPSVHHWISFDAPEDAEEGVYLDTGCGQGALFGGGGFGGGQNLIYDNPPHGVVAPENAGIVREVSGKSVCLGVMGYNLSDKPRLREAWVNLYFTDKPKVMQTTGAVSMVGGLGLNLPPGQKKQLTYTGTFDKDGRILQLFGNRGMWTTRLAVWLNDELVYDSYDWQAAVTFAYDSITTNPSIDTAGMHDGAVSGMLPFKAGARLKYSCFIDNRSDELLRFRNDIESGEMCNLWGSTVGGIVSGMFQ